MTEEQHPGGDEDRSVGPGRALDTLRIPSFLPFWLSNVLQFLCFQVQSMTMQWLITSLTDSRTALGAIGFVQGGTMAIASPIAGVVVDRFPKRRLLIFGRVGLATLVLCISAGVVTEQIELWHLAIAAMIGGLLAVLGWKYGLGYGAGLYEALPGMLAGAAIYVIGNAISVETSEGEAA